jgi:pimeloyl-ACP methyl ester carboxylesterase
MRKCLRVRLAWVALSLGAGACHYSDDPPPPTCSLSAFEALGLAGVTVSEAALITENTESTGNQPRYPAHCRVVGAIDSRQGSDGKPYAIGFELRLPVSAVGDRLFFQGGGGTDGVIVPAYGDLINRSDTTALAEGYAVVSTDGGHATGVMDASFGLDPQARLDYGYNAVGRVTRVSKALMAGFYGRPVARAFFMGCSNGGRQAMVAASRFATEFDGIVAVDPGFNLPKAALAQAWDTRQFFAAGSGQLPKDTFTAAKLELVASSIRARCDALDGLADGIVHDTASCQQRFDLQTDVPTCGSDTSAACLSPPEKTALAQVFAGVKDSAGADLYATWPWDPGLVGSGWRFWKLDAGFAPLPLNTLVGAAALGFVFTTPPDQPDLSDGGVGYQLSTNLDEAAQKIRAVAGRFTESAMDFMTPPHPTDLSEFKRRGGKLIVVHGTADPVFSSDDTVAWYRQLAAADETAPSYARLFLVPGMNHCFGGPAAERFDTLSAIQDWVENEQRPEAISARVNPLSPDVVAQGWPTTRERVLCPYPKQAVLVAGAADTERMESFACASATGALTAESPLPQRSPLD